MDQQDKKTQHIGKHSAKYIASTQEASRQDNAAQKASPSETAEYTRLATGICAEPYKEDIGVVHAEDVHLSSNMLTDPDASSVWKRRQTKKQTIPSTTTARANLKGTNKRVATRGPRHGLPSRRVSWQNRTEQEKRNIIFAIAAVVVVIAIIAVAWIRRPIEVTVDGSRRTVASGTSLVDVINKENEKFIPGNLVSVSGKVLEERKGTQYTATVNGQQLSQDQVNTTQLHGGEKIILSSGQDVMEPHETQTRNIAPQLEFSGKSGNVAYVSRWGRPGIIETLKGSISGETAEKEAQKAQNTVISFTNIEPNNDEKLVALVINEVSDQESLENYIDLLSQKQAKATFNESKDELSSCGDAVKQASDQGMQFSVCVQNYSALNKVTEQNFLSPIQDTQAFLKDKTGTASTIACAPNGALGAKAWLASEGKLAASFTYSVKINPSKYTTVDALSAHMTKLVDAGNILFFDAQNSNAKNIEALSSVIDALQAKGYKFVTISELLDSDPSIPDDVASGKQTLPDGGMWPEELADK